MTTITSAGCGGGGHLRVLLIMVMDITNTYCESTCLPVCVWCESNCEPHERFPKNHKVLDETLIRRCILFVVDSSYHHHSKHHHQ